MTVLAEVEGILNSKPLGYARRDIADPDPITPNLLLMGRRDASLPQAVYGDCDLLGRRRWKHSQVLADHFWAQFTLRSEHGIRYVKLPSASSTSSVLRFLENMCQHLESDSLFSSQPFSSFGNNTRFYNRTKSEPLSHPENGLSKEDSTKDAAPSTHPSHTTSDYRVTKKERPYYPGHSHTPPPLRRVSSNPTELGQMCPPRRVEAASSTTGPDHVKQDKEGSGSDTSSWSVDDVMRFVQEADPQTLGPHVELFRKHEIDGEL
ncbi:polycomb protein SCMH1-like [Notothenia coriiceps]|uniref:Polycomb protein SCMH1-like n=1 Tax=Notothenia coriiceps TaxID=8208 RepID=A0A6I9NUA1_9TELE|nr:PREDICTED: polycomb protein SCMH1-like [Notothenia coriiceps]